MMPPRWVNLNIEDRAAFRATIAFLNGRLEERATIEWALGLKPNETIKRLALLDLIGGPSGHKLREPWRSAWRLVEESMSSPPVEDPSTGVYHVKDWLQVGDKSGALIAEIVALVAPRLKIKPFSDLYSSSKDTTRRPRKVGDLFSAEITSAGDLADLSVLDLGSLTDRSFLVSLALALDAAVASGLDIAKRIGWDGEHRPWQLGLLYRVYYVTTAEDPNGNQDPDEHHQGIAPSVKFLHAVVSRLLEIDISAAMEFVQRWKLADSPVHQRLWAALSRDPRVTPANEVLDFLMSLNDRSFWDLDNFPEVAELRAKRFGELGPHKQASVTARLRKRPPRSMWPHEVDISGVDSARLYWAARELRRIEIAQAALPNRDKAWLDSKIGEFPELGKMDRVDTGFPEGTKIRSVLANPDRQYDLLVGEKRLKALEIALSSAHRGWQDDPAGRATDWIRQGGNSLKIIADFESTPDGGANYPRVWEKFGWTHSPGSGQTEGTEQRNLAAESASVLSLLAKLPEEIARQSINGIAHWISTWERQLASLPESLSIWLKLWPIAVDATNTKVAVKETMQSATVTKYPDPVDPTRLDTLNSPTGKLVGFFLAACPNLSEENPRPFDADGAPRRMRDAIIAASGSSKLIALHRFIEHLPYFMNADPSWTNDHLIAPLIADNSEALTLWQAIALHTRFEDVLAIIGAQMSERAIDLHLSRETRKSLVFSLIIECLYSFLEGRKPAVPYSRVQQMIRSLDDEVRAYGADAVQRFIRDKSAPLEGTEPLSPAQIFRTAAAPFLQHVWPLERSLATPGVSRALADIPATAQEAFAEAVDAIERFLVPFECWSMIEYGLYGEKDGKPKLASIDNGTKAAAFLRLLDLTIGTAEGSVIPHELAEALEQVRKVAQKLSETPIFRRLATVARRG